MIRALLGPIVVALVLAGCGRGDEPTKIDWDLSRSHTMQDVDWDDPTSNVLEIDSVDSVRLRFSDGREVMETGGIGRVNVARDGERLVDMAIFSEPLTLDEAHRLALRWGKDWTLPTAKIDQWHADGGPSNLEVFDPDEPLALNHPSVVIKFLYSFVKAPKTQIVSLQFDWIVEAPKPRDQPVRPPT